MINKIFKTLLERLPENNRFERIWILAKTDFKKRYYGTSLGIVWAMINPLSQLVIYSLVFSVLFKNDIPNYTLYLFSGLILWMFFSESTKKGMHIFPSNLNLLENVRIKKSNILTAAMFSNLFTLAFNLVVFFIISIFFSLPYNINILYLPLILLNLIILVYGINLIVSVVYVYLRDFDHFWDIFIFGLFWANPIVYSESFLYQNKIVLALNPVAGIIVNMHNSLIYGRSLDFPLLIWDFAYSIFIFVIGVVFFKHYSKKITEIL